ncbi:MAG: NAD(P)H-dependent oxidoreductase subunit E [Planctomycetota bacterium]|nr:NAD(P)H-dependent oxidoreductase subunit E [Planctomycetota bacterium]
MSWKTKPSATTKIPTRAAPYLDEKMRGGYERDLLPRYATRQSALLPILHDIQHRERHIPMQAMVEIASFLKITPAEVLDTMSFYEEFSREPRGRCIISVCQSIACEACGHSAIVDEVKSLLGIDDHETTSCGSFTLLPLECLGSCDSAPVALFGETLHENLTVEKVRELVAKARQSSCSGSCEGGAH